MSAIRIDEPCHENWNEMNPTERGAFCQSCAIDVYDFSKMNLDQVKLVLKENAGSHFCGRFDKRQLQTLNAEFEAWQLQQPRSFQSRFVFALLLVFGLTLFSCNEEDAKQVAQLNTIELRASLAEPEERMADQLFFMQDAIIANEMIPSVEPVELMVMGEMAYYEPIDVVSGKTQNDVTLNQTQMLGMVAGGPMIQGGYIEYLEQTIDSSESTLAEPVVTVYNPFETKLYPNPTADASRFSLYVHEQTQFVIEIYSISGQKIQELFSGELQDGRHDFDVDLSGEKPGTYLVRVWSEQQQETVKLLKVE